MKEVEDRGRGRQLFNAVERILDDTENIIALVERHKKVVRKEDPGASNEEIRNQVAERLVRHYSKATAISGGVTALPSMLPGLGTLVTLTGGTLADVGLMLKFEVEMALALLKLYGYDITLERERQLAFLLASISAHDVQSGKSFVKDVAMAEGVAIWNYAPRQVPKMLVQVMARLASRGAAKGLARAMPVLGIAFGTTLNKVLTERVGKRCIRELDERRAAEAPQEQDEEVVDAVVGARKRAGKKTASRRKKAPARKKPEAKKTTPA